jgi:hypothetical protein
MILAIVRLLCLAALGITTICGMALAGVGALALDITLTTGQAGWSGVAISATMVTVGGLLALLAGFRLRELRHDADEIIF